MNVIERRWFRLFLNREQWIYSAYYSGDPVCMYKSKKIFLLLEFNFITKILLHFKIVDVFNLWHEHTYDIPLAQIGH